MKEGLSKQERAFFATAKELALLSNHKQQLGCIIVDKHHIIGSGHNSRTRFHKVQAELDKKFFNDDAAKGPIHAELDALLPLIKRHYDLSSATVYIFRTTKAGMIGLARPCPRCMSVIKSCGIKRIKYTTNDGFAFEKISK